MVHVSLKDLYRREYAVIWALLSFKAGLMNAAGFFFAGSYVSHVTGFGTQIGIALGHQQIDLGIELLVIPIAFIGGGVLTSLLLDRGYSVDRIPNYPLVQFLITALLGLIALLCSWGVFERNPEFPNGEKSVVLIGLLCLVCGLKNSLTTWATHGKIRTTHLTGLSTDIGLHLPKLFQSEGANSRYREPKKVNYVRILTFFSFSGGSCVAAMLLSIIGYKIFYFTFGLSLFLLTISIVHRQRLLESVTLQVRSGGESDWQFLEVQGVNPSLEMDRLSADGLNAHEDKNNNKNNGFYV